MNFKKAVKSMQKGKLLQRGNNSFNHYYMCDKDGTISYHLDGKFQCCDWIFSLEDFEANDWEVADQNLKNKL